jgi:hypothetical protein
MGGVLISGDPSKGSHSGAPILKKAFHAFEDFGGRMCRMNNSSKLAAVSHAMSKPARELLHFAYTIGQVGSINFPIVVHE